MKWSRCLEPRSFIDLVIRFHNLSAFSLDFLLNLHFYLDWYIVVDRLGQFLGQLLLVAFCLLLEKKNIDKIIGEIYNLLWGRGFGTNQKIGL